MPTWTDFVKWLIPIIVVTLSFLLLNLVITTSDPNDIWTAQMKCIKSHLYHVVFISTCNVFIVFMFVFITVLHTLPICTVYIYVCYVWHWITNQSTSQMHDAITGHVRQRHDLIGCRETRTVGARSVLNTATGIGRARVRQWELLFSFAISSLCALRTDL